MVSPIAKVTKDTRPKNSTCVHLPSYFFSDISDI